MVTLCEWCGNICRLHCMLPLIFQCELVVLNSTDHDVDC